jgi:5-methylcytosine-specific restriction endonuclease McrA
VIAERTELPISQSEARRVGSKLYFTGKPCPHGHVAPRFTSNFGCVECLHSHTTKYFQKNRERLNERAREYAKQDVEGNRRRSWEAMHRNRSVGRETVRLSEWKELLDKHGGRCVRCGSQDHIQVDHIIPLSKGGTNTLDNIQPLCRRCNSGKKNRTRDFRTGVSNG